MHITDRPLRNALAFLLLALSLLSVCRPAGATEVWAFTDQAHALTADSSARVIMLDASSQIEAELSRELLSRPDQAALQLRARLSAHGGDLQRRLISAYQGVADAWSLGIARIPAVVVDRRYVVYGEPDVSKAVARIEAFRRREP